MRTARPDTGDTFGMREVPQLEKHSLEHDYVATETARPDLLPVGLA